MDDVVVAKEARQCKTHEEAAVPQPRTRTPLLPVDKQLFQLKGCQPKVSSPAASDCALYVRKRRTRKQRSPNLVPALRANTALLGWGLSHLGVMPVPPICGMVELDSVRSPSH